MALIRLIPTWVPDATMDHIHGNHEHHISREEIKEVMRRDARNLDIVRSSNQHKSDVNVKGRSLDGKLLHLCVILNNDTIHEWVHEQKAYDQDPDRLCSIVYNGWMISS